MRDLFQTYGNVLFVDGTYKLNKIDYPCIVLVVTDHNRQSRIVGFALVAFERQIIIDTVLDYFRQLNDTSHLKVVMIDKDLKEDSAVTKAFPNAQKLYCFWHNEKTFKKAFSNKKTFPDRHRIKVELIKASKCDNIHLVTNLPSMNNVKSLITSNKMDNKSKYNAAFRVSQEIANNIAQCKQPEFELYLSRLLDFSSHVKNKSMFNIDAEQEEEQEATLHDNNATADLDDDQISSSQVSTASSSSNNFVFDNKTMAKGVAPGRKPEHKQQLMHSQGDLSAYSANTTSHDLISEASNKPKKFKSELILDSSSWLSDEQINYALSLISQSTKLNGLIDTVILNAEESLAKHLPKVVPFSAFIVHAKDNWITVSNAKPDSEKKRFI
jgi:hypothetical protein